MTWVSKSPLDLKKETMRIMSKSPEELQAALREELAKSEPDPRAILSLSNKLADTAEGFLRFSVDAAHIDRLGLELVGKQETALSELIKNSYDADATEVTLTFSKQDKPGGQLVIEDNGSGMSDEIVRSGWMRIATTEKINNPKSHRYKRKRAGRKGIGRFSAQRLGRRLILETGVEHEAEGIQATFNWDRDFVPGRELGEIWNAVEPLKKSKENHGTRLIIQDLRDKWPDGAITRMWRSVMLLQPPFRLSNEKSVKKRDQGKSGSQPDPGFRVVINNESRAGAKELRSLEKNFLAHALAIVNGQIDKNGYAKFRVQSEKLELDEQIDFERQFSSVGPVHLNTHYFIYRRDSLSGLNLDLAKQLGNRYGGIRVYRDGFRLLPYGETEEGNDWLRLQRDTGRRNLLVPANNQNWFGEVGVSSEANPLLDETSSREGFVENEAFLELRDFARSCLEWAALRVAAKRKRKVSTSQKGFVSEIQKKPSEAITEAIEVAKKSVGVGEQVQAKESVVVKLERAKDEAESFEAAVAEREEEFLAYEAMLRILASLGISVSIFSHEVKASRTAVNAAKVLLERLLDKLETAEAKAEATEKIKCLAEAIDRVFDLGGYIDGLVEAYSSRELETVSVRGAIETFVNQFSKYMSKQNIRFRTSVSPPGLRTCPIHRSELDSVLFNFLTNSVKSLRKSGAQDRKIDISARRSGKWIQIKFQDNGVGVPAEDENRIFDAFYTTTFDSVDELTGRGTGLGLRIVSDIATSYGGGVELVEASEGYSCCFEFRVLAFDGGKI